jgi:hypothetical protein
VRARGLGWAKKIESVDFCNSPGRSMTRRLPGPDGRDCLSGKFPANCSARKRHSRDLTLFVCEGEGPGVRCPSRVFETWLADGMATPRRVESQHLAGKIEIGAFSVSGPKPDDVALFHNTLSNGPRVCSVYWARVAVPTDGT